MKKRIQCDVAIVGMACHFPGASNYQQYWQNLVAKKNSIQEIPADRWDIETHYSSGKNQASKSISKWCGLIEDIKSFDNDFFNISPIEARNMDPQQRLLLQESWHCIEDSSIPLSTLQEAKTSVFVGAMTSDYLQTLNKSQDANNRYSILGNDHCILANRISHQLNFSGESISVNAASASSLVAIHKAKSSLVLGECDYAIAAGVNLNTDPFKYIVFSQAGMLSPDGQCKSFADDANGYVPGDGVAALLLQPLEQAIKNNHHIYGVLKGSAINHIGSGKSITVPCANAQADVITDALKNAGKHTSDIGYIEAHGSGTPLGDPVEIESLNRVFKGAADDVIIGTVKPNIGHLEAAAGIAGVIKALLVLKHQYIPSNINLNKVNPVLNLNGSKLKLASGDLLNTFDKSCIGVSSFGFGGVSCHLILENHPNESKVSSKSNDNNTEHFVLSAKSKSSLRGSIGKWQHFLHSPESNSSSIRDICASVATGREQFSYRLGFTVANKDELLKELKHIKLVSNKRRTMCSFVFADNQKSELKSDTPLITQHYDKLLKEAKLSEQYDDKKAFSVFRSADIQSTLMSVAVFKAIQELGVNPSLIEQVGQSVWSALLSSECVSLDDYLAVVLHNKKLSDVAFYHPKYPLKISHQSKVLYPEYVNQAFMQGFFKEIENHQERYQNIIDQANSLLINDGTFTEILSVWNYSDENQSNLFDTLKNFSDVLLEDIPKAAYAVVAANVSLNRFYKKWMFECGDSQGFYHIAFLSDLITKKLLSHSAFYKVSQKRAEESEKTLGKLNRRYWQEINELVCEDKKHQHKKVIRSKAPLVLAINSKESFLSKNPNKVPRISIGQVASDLKSKFIHEVAKIEQWQQCLLDFWLQGVSINWNKLYPMTSFNSLPLPGYTFEKINFWTTAKQSDHLIKTDLSPKMDKMSDNDVIDESPISSNQNVEVKRKSPDMPPSQVAQTTVTLFANQLSMDPDKVNVNKNMETFGLDSMAYTDLSSHINDRFDTSFTPACFYGFKNIQDLIEAINESIKTKPSISNHSEVSHQDGNDSKPKQFSQLENNDDIAIVGYAGQLPNANSLEQFWLNIMAGVDGITEVPAFRWNWQDHYSKDLRDTNKSPSKWGGFISDIDHFDAAFFGISPQEAKLMDPQQRLLLQTVWHAIEHSGHQPNSLAGSQTGVFIGASTSDYEEIIRANELVAHASTGMNRSIIANRISFVLDLQGPSEVVDTACSSSLVAIHKAVKAIKAGDCQTALAGGVNALITPTHYISYGKAGMLSPEGKCKTFDKDANGYVRAEGVGVVVLKSLSQATRDNDTVHAIIKASGTNHGGKASSLTAPNPNAQAQLIFDTYQQAGIKSHSIDYIENHGTGTPLGDPIEINGLNQAFDRLSKTEKTEQHQHCKLASVKSNIGHLEAAAGIAGVLKVIMALKHEALPASQNIDVLNPFIKLDENRFEILQKNQPWPSQPEIKLRRAGVSSFGFGGVNAHIVLEEFINKQQVDIETFEKDKAPNEPKQSLVILSAKTQSSLIVYAQNYLDYFKHVKTDEVAFKNLAYTTQVGRNHEKYRLALCVYSQSDLCLGLKDFVSKRSSSNFFFGQVETEKNHAMFDDKLNVFWNKGAFKTLAKLWVKGLQIDWNLFYVNHQNMQRMVLPVYPFNKKSHWLYTVVEPKHTERNADKPKKLIPQEKNQGIPQNKSTPVKKIITQEASGIELKTADIKPYTYKILNNHFLSQEHEVDGLKIAPGVLSLELIFAALQAAEFNFNEVILKDIYWKAPIVFNGSHKNLYVTNSKHNKGWIFEVQSSSKIDQKTIIFTQAFCSHKKASIPDPFKIDFQDFKPIVLTDIYERLKEVGFVYGSQFRVVRKVLYHQGKYIAKLKLNQLPNDNDTFMTDPRLLDGALQTCLIGLLDQGLLQKNSTYSYVPMMIEQVKVIKQIPETVYVYMRSNMVIKMQQDSCVFDLQIVDSDQQLCVEISQIVFKQFKKTKQANAVIKQVHKPAVLIKKNPLTTPKLQTTANISIESGFEPNNQKRNSDVSNQKLFDKTIEYFTSKIAETAAIEPSEIDVKQSFKEYGIDSFLTLSIIRNLEDDFGDLRKTLLFEASNVNELVEIFITEHKETLVSMFKLESKVIQPSENTTSKTDTKSEHTHSETLKSIDSFFQENKLLTNKNQKNTGTESETNNTYSVLTASSIEQPTALAETIKQLFSNYGGESIALSRKDIAPHIFVCGRQLGMFYFNTHKNILLAFRYVGPEDFFLEAILELESYCKENQLHLNVLSEALLTNAQKYGLSANAFGVVQRVAQIENFGLNGSKMRRLRYQVNKFQQSGVAKTKEYKVGSDARTDDALAGMIEKWAANKSGVNPYIWRVKDEMETGCLGEEYRIFLTYLDGSLQNVIIISRIESDNSYLLDTEFYSNEMAMGAMEFGISEIINTLKSEGCEAFSLGLTFGASFIESDQSNPEVSKTFEKLAKDQIFEESGNFQFKNKFRCVNSPLLLYRTEDQSAKNVLDIIMMIGNPNCAQPDSPVLEYHSQSINDLSIKEVLQKTKEHKNQQFKKDSSNEERILVTTPDTVTSNQNTHKSEALHTAGYNPFNLSRKEIEFDLATDSWSELEYLFIKQRTELLQNKNQDNTLALEDLVADVFGLPYVLPFSAGRVAESFFCPAWPKEKKYILQNALFPTCLFHQVNNDFIPVEVVDKEFLNRNSNHMFKGNIDCSQLRSKLQEYDNDVAMVWIELANNAAGGCPVSISNLREIKSVIGDIPLVIDATRIIENAYHIAAYEEPYLNHDIWSIVKEICSYADAINASLTKDFGTHIGGFFATRDPGLFAKIQDSISTNGSGLSRMDRQLVCHAILDKSYILNSVKQRMDGVLQLAEMLINGGLTVVQPIGGHCVLIDPMSIDGLSELETPLPSFLAWLYKNTGIRAGVHSVGRQRNTSMNNLIRLAIPVGMNNQQITTVAERLIGLFNTNDSIDELQLENKPHGLFGEMKANYVVKKSIQLNLSGHNSAENVVKESIDLSNNNTDPVKQVDQNNTVDKLDNNNLNVQEPHKGNVRQSNTEKKSTSNNSIDDQGIAVIGMSGRYPDAVNLGQFWNNLTQGLNSIKSGPDWGSRFFDENTVQHLGGFIDDVDKFDSLFFSISPREAQNMDPQERMVMEVSWEALEDSGYHPESLADTLGSNQVGVFVGAVWSYYEMLGAENRHLGGSSIANSQHWGISNRVSSFMNFTGPSLTVDTACSSSLTAIHLACESILNGECKMALASGVNLDLHPSKHHITHAAQFLSDDGLCRAFGRGGSGYVAGEGVGTLVLKPLKQAELDGDHIYGVIKSTATNHGGRTSGYTVPNPNAQADLISLAIKKANINAATISYVEAHGTGTELGDPVEIQGATKAYRKDTQKKQYCSIGSVKTNIGHLEAAAGIAGATKLLLQMKHKQLVPSLHSTELNEYIDFDNSPFYVQQNKSYWQPLEIDGQMIPRRAGLSSFGAGGTNVHIIFEEHQPLTQNRPVYPVPEQLLFVLSARKEQGLHTQAVNLLMWLEDNNNQPINLVELAHTLQVGRLSMSKRLAISAKNKDSLINNLKDFVDNKSNDSVFISDPKTQFALDLFDGNESKQIIEILSNNGSFNKLAKLWVNGVDIDWNQNHQSVIRKISLPTYPFAKESHWIDSLNQQQNTNKPQVTQPHKSLATEIHPLIDHDLSTTNQREYSKEFTLNQFVFRDHIVDGLPTLPGVAYMEMARIAAEHASGFQVNTLKNLIWASPINSQSSSDIRIKLDHKEGIRAYEICTFDQSGKKHIHSQGKAVCIAQPNSVVTNKNIQAIKERCHGYMSKTACYDLLATRKLTYGAALQSINGFHYGSKEGLTELKLPTNLIHSFFDYQAHPSILDGAVQSIISLLECANTKTQSGVPYVPFVLSELLIHKPLTQNGYAHLTLNEGKKERDDIKKINIDIMSEEGEVLIQMKDFSFKAISEQEQIEAKSPIPPKYNELAQQDVVLYQPAWQPKEIQATSECDDETLILFDNNLAHKEELISNQDCNFSSIVLVGTHESFLKIDSSHYQLDPTNTSHLQKLIDSLLADDLTPNKIIHNLASHVYTEEISAIKNDLNNGLYSVFLLSQVLLKNRKAIGSHSNASEPLSLTYLYHCQDDLAQPCNGAVNAFMRSIKHEGANIDCKTVCINHEPSDDKQLPVNWHMVLKELIQNNDIEIMHKQHQRFCRVLKPVSIEDKIQSTPSCELSKSNGVYLITGGAGGLGLIFAEEMLKTSGVKLVLTGRSASNDFITAKLNKLGGQVEYSSCDLTDGQSVTQLIRKTTEKYGHINGVIHAAGIIKDGFLWNKELPQFASVLSAKVIGTHHLDQATKQLDLDYFILCSSIASIIGNMGQSDYAAGNRFMDDFAVLRSHWVQQGRRKGRSISINWPLWKSGGMQVNEQAEQWMFDNWGMKPLASEIGLQGLRFIVEADIPVVGMVQGDARKIYQALAIEPTLNDLATKNQTQSNLSQTNTKTVNAVIKTGSVVNVELNHSEHSSMAEKLQIDLTTMVVKLLKINESDITFTDNMSTYGFDSVTFTEFANLINSELEIDVTPLIFFEQETLEELTEYLLEDFSEPLAVHYKNLSSTIEPTLAVKEPKELTPDTNSSLHENVPGNDANLHTNRREHFDESNKEKDNNNHDTITRDKNEDIAIIGMSGVMPQSADLDEFWQNLIDERNLITEIPKDRWDWKKFYGESDLGNSKTEIKWGGFMPDVDKFDAEFFNISPLEAELTDPQQRVFLQSVWHAIEDSGYKTKELSGSNTGVFVGIGSSDYHELLREQSSDFEAYSVAGWMHAVLANRISYFFNWSGPSEPIGTACSSTLVAVDRAIRAIRSGQCDMCVAGGVSMLLNPGVHVGLGKASMLADDGRCKSFDHKANGYVRSEGVGALLLKPLHQAQADGDRIHAVIKGTAVNHGGHVNTFTTPNPKAQADVLNMAFKDANIDPATLTYIETHGTGTALGDPIEIQGLLKAFKNHANKTGQMPELSEYCTLGSVKTNAGHLELASGMAGISKLILCLKNKTIPANINFEKINPYIKLENTPFRLATETKTWDQISDIEQQLVPRRAGISSFGFGGVNAHLIIEEYTGQQKTTDFSELNAESKLAQIIVLSTKHSAGLLQQAKQLIAYIKSKQTENTLPALETLAAGYQQGRDAMSERLAIIANSYVELLNHLETYCNGGIADRIFKSKQNTKNKVEDVEINQWLNDKDLTSLAQCWVSGKDIDWYTLNPRTEKITLPIYPFQKNRYWLLDSSYTGACLNEGGEINSNLSDDGIQLSLLNNVDEDTHVFDVLIDANSHYLQDHQIAGFNLLPAAGYLELLNHASHVIENKNINSFNSVQWIEPATTESINQGLQLKLIKNNRGFEFTFIKKTNNDEIYCQGSFDLSDQEVLQTSEKFDNNQLGSISFEKNEVYRVFNKADFQYGKSLQVINRMNVDHDREVFAELKLPDVFSQIDSNMFHCAMVDGTLQCMLGILLFQASETEIQIPVSVKKIEWVRPLTETAYVAIKEIGQNFTQSQQIKSRVFDIQIYDSSGQISVKLSSFEIRNLMSEANTNTSTNVEAESVESTKLSKEKTVEFLRQMIAHETKRGYINVDVNTNFDNFGIDSFLALRMTKKLEKTIGPIAKTVFFEHKTVNDLAGYLVATHTEALDSELNNNNELNNDLNNDLHEEIIVNSQVDEQVTTINDSLLEATIAFLTDLVSTETKREPAKIKADASLESLGIDSFLALRMTKKIEKEVGAVPKAMFFEHNNIESLAQYLAQEYKESLESVLNIRSNDELKIVEELAYNKSNTKLNKDSLVDATTRFLIELVAAETKREPAKIKADASLESLGIDSFLALRMTKKIEKQVGAVPKAIFFEHNNIESLAEYLAQEHKDALASVLQVRLETPLPPHSNSSNEVKTHEVEPAKETNTLLESTQTLLKKMIAEESKRDESSIHIDTHFESLGIDSFLALRMTKKLEKMTGTISKTAFFEYTNIESMTQYLISEHANMLQQTLGVTSVETIQTEHEPDLGGRDVSELLIQKTAEYLAEIVALETKRDSSYIKFDAALDSYGVDSFLALRMTKKLEKVVGQISKTVFFEHNNINDLVAYLLKNHATELSQYFDIHVKHSHVKQDLIVGSQSSVLTARNNNSSQENHTGKNEQNKICQPLVIREDEIQDSSNVAKTIKRLFRKYGKENKALARHAIAPLIFLGSNSKAYFNFNINGDVALAFTFVGENSELENLASEFTDYCIKENLLANMLLEHVLENDKGHEFSFNPFGMMQRLHDIKSMSLQGSKMRRLRYQISKFKQSGECQFSEYINGQDKSTDESIGNMIDQWADTKTMVNPYIWHVKDSILKGTLTEPHRIFITQIDGVLQNVIIITKLASENGYLMDLEFYSKDMPLGGLEYSIWQILQKLSTENYEVFSLGATFGVLNDQATQVDPAVTAVLSELQEQGVFDGQGNLQFKNKFRPENKTLFLVRPVNDDPEKVIDVIMMIANPVMEDVIKTQNNWF